jgi:hypothetical protein
MGFGPPRAIFVLHFFLMEMPMCFAIAFDGCGGLAWSTTLYDSCGWSRFLACIFRA